ncbi:MAG: UDP-N-acetylmuramate--L-alanine ligase [Anaerolineales bacterium]
MTHVHFIGIGGSGLSAIARVLLESGYTVSGSDQILSPLAEELQRLGAKVDIGHRAEQVQGADWVVRSSAIPDDNVEVQAARQAGIPVYKRADFLGHWMEGKTGIAVAGTHGKTTTTAMIAWMLTALGQDPTFIIGGVMRNLGVNAHAGRGEAFVIEADEYDRMFLGLRPRIAVVTNVEHDHPDCYPKFIDILMAFESFVELLPADGTLIACAENAGASHLMTVAQRSNRHVVAYTAEEQLTVRASNWVMARGLQVNEYGGFTFRARTNLHYGHSATIALRLPGRHNVRNALAAWSVALVLGLPPKQAAEALEAFQGTGRRFEVRGEVNGITLIDDYAHHPTEIEATLEAARSRYGQRRLWALWQPHTYSRTQALLAEFARVFYRADEVIVTEIYRAREPVQPFSAQAVAKQIDHPAVRFIPTLEEATDYLEQNLRPGDILLVLSAGDADRVTSELMRRLEKTVDGG